MTDKIIDKVLDSLKGFDFWFALVILVIAIAVWYWIGAKITERKKLFRQFAMVLGAIIIAGVAISVHHLCFSTDYAFPKGVPGILVLRINGDAAQNSLQTDLVSSLNTELNKESPAQRIEVRAGEQSIDEALGLPHAHGEAREIGRKLRASLVVWGNRIVEKKGFHPRITIVTERISPLLGERHLAMQNIGELNLPDELVDQPIYLTHFVTGYLFFCQKQYTKALGHFQQALGYKVASHAELAYLKFYAGSSHCYLAQGQKTIEDHLWTAIGFFQEALGYFQSNNLSHA